jgi:hypothetical protein
VFLCASQPQVLKTLYKGRRYETKLRELDELCGKAYQQALEKLHKVHCHYSRPSIVLELEEEEFCYAGALCSIAFAPVSLVWIWFLAYTTLNRAVIVAADVRTQHRVQFQPRSLHAFASQTKFCARHAAELLLFIALCHTPQFHLFPHGALLNPSPSLK